MKLKTLLSWGVLGLMAVLLNSCFIVEEGQRALVLRFGRVRRQDSGVELYGPGCFFKLPWIDQVQRLDAKIQTLSHKADRFLTAEKKDVIIDFYVKWRVVDFLQFYISTHGGRKQVVQRLIFEKIGDRLRAEVGSRTIHDIVSGSRGELTEGVLQASTEMVSLGIELIDIRVKQINLPPEVSNSIYQRMRAERESVAREHRAQGKEQSERLRAYIDGRVAIALSKARYEAARLRCEGEAEAMQLLAEGMGQDAALHFYLKSLSAYRDSFTEKDLLMLHPERDPFAPLFSPVMLLPEETSS